MQAVICHPLRGNMSAGRNIGGSPKQVVVMNRISTRLWTSTLESYVTQVGICDLLQGGTSLGQNVVGGLKPAIVPERILNLVRVVVQRCSCDQT